MGKQINTAEEDQNFKPYKLKRPCSNCPYLKGTPLFLNRMRAEGLARDVFFHGGTFACHKTTETDDDGEVILTAKQSECAGAAIMQLKTNNPSQWMQISIRMGWAESQGINSLDLDSPVFDTVQDFVDYHSNGRSSRGSN